MSNTIDLPTTNGYHFGAMYHLKPFIGKWFEEMKSETNIINKAFIIDIEYNPDNIYSTTDGCAGNCWTAKLSDSREINGSSLILYNFRNFRDLVIHYEKEGFKFM